MADQENEGLLSKYTQGYSSYRNPTSAPINVESNKDKRKDVIANLKSLRNK